MFKEHYRKNNIFVSSLFKHTTKQKIFFSHLLLKIGGRKNEKNRKEKFSVLVTAERSGGVGAITLPRTRGVVCLLRLPRARRVNWSYAQKRFEQRLIYHRNVRLRQKLIQQHAPP